MDTDEVLVLLVLVVGIPFAIACVVMFFITWWKIFEKGGEGGWAIFVPFYGAYILGKVAGGVSFGISVLIVAMIYFLGFLVALVVIGIAMDSKVTYNIISIIYLPWAVIRLIIAFKLGGKFGRGVWFRVFLAVPYLDAFPHLYLALSKNCVYNEKPKEASVWLFVAIVLLIPMLLVFTAVAIPRFVATRTDPQVATARIDMASAQKAVVAKVFADNIDTKRLRAPNGESWGKWIIEIAGLDKNRWKTFGTNGVYPIDIEANRACYDESELPLLWINPRDGNMHFNPSRLSSNYKGDSFCENLMYSYGSSGGNGDKIVPLASRHY